MLVRLGSPLGSHFRYSPLSSSTPCPWAAMPIIGMLTIRKSDKGT